MPDISTNPATATSSTVSRWAQTVDARLLLAVLALGAYVLVVETFSFYPPKLSGDQAASILSTLSNLTVVAFMYYFHKADVS